MSSSPPDLCCMSSLPRSAPTPLSLRPTATAAAQPSRNVTENNLAATEEKEKKEKDDDDGDDDEEEEEKN